MKKTISDIISVGTAIKGFEMTSTPPKSLKEVFQQNNLNKHGEYFIMDLSEYDTVYFFPVIALKNGGLQGVMFIAYAGSLAGKAKIDSVSKMDFNRYKHASKNEVPKKVVQKMDEKIGKLYKKASGD